jgi:hypothetical protein
VVVDGLLLRQKDNTNSQSLGVMLFFVVLILNCLERIVFVFCANSLLGIFYYLFFRFLDYYLNQPRWQAVYEHNLFLGGHSLSSS